MRIVLFCHSLVSDWNHGNAHFLRGIVTELLDRGHEVRVYEPEDGWSREQLLATQGPGALEAVQCAFPHLPSLAVNLETLDLDAALDGADVVLVHEWNPHSLVSRIGAHKARGGDYVLLFHDTHHRSVTDPGAMAAYDLEHYDGVLAFGEVIRERYLSLGWGRRAWTWHEAADTRTFTPLPDVEPESDLVWIGNWGDGERTAEIRSYLVEPVRELELEARVYGVRYPEEALAELRSAGIAYGGWLPNHEAPLAYARHRMSVHIPRRQYVESLRGIPTIRVFEALACGVPLISAWWEDAEGLFRPGENFLVAGNPGQMREHLRTLASDASLRADLASSGLEVIRSRHTCAHRVDELMLILRQVQGRTAGEALTA
ncbi:glycosyltransferase [soil metagenome]